MKSLIAMFIFMAAASAQAQGPDLHVLQMDPAFPVEMMQSPGVVVHPVREVSQLNETIVAEDRDLILNKANLEKITKSWDALEKDMLLLRAEKQDPVRAADKYGGKITTEKMAQLKKLIGVYRKQRSKK